MEFVLVADSVQLLEVLSVRATDLVFDELSA
jgi:hypothetical protein